VITVPVELHVVDHVRKFVLNVRVSEPMFWCSLIQWGRDFFLKFIVKCLLVAGECILRQACDPFVLVSAGNPENASRK
jgi:hypothetical protein